MASPHPLLAASAQNHLFSCSFHTAGYNLCGWRQRHVELQVSHLVMKVEGGCRKRSKCNHVTLASSIGGENKGLGTFQPNSSNGVLRKGVLEPLLRFPWDKFSERFSEHVVETLWTVGKWFLVPILVVSAIREVIFAISMGKELFIPLGLLGGTVAGGILRDIALSFGTIDCRGGELPFSIILSMGLLFGAMKVISYKSPFLWVHVCLLQFSNAGLWQTIRFANWRRNFKKISTREDQTM